jgi:hypothetical protein
MSSISALTHAPRWYGVILVTLVAAASLAGGASAGTQPSRLGSQQDRLTPQAVTPASAVQPDVFERAVERELRSASARPDNVSTAPLAAIAARDDAFQWDDAMYGAAAALGVVARGGTIAASVRRRGRVILR